MSKNNKGKKKEGYYYRTAIFPINPDPAQEDVLRKWSSLLLRLWNAAQIVKSAALQAETAYKKLFLANEIDEDSWKIYRHHLRHSTTFFSFVNTLTSIRALNEDMRQISRSSQEETFDRLIAAFTSYEGLKKKKDGKPGDRKAKWPYPKTANHFIEIPLRSGFKVKDGVISLSCKLAGEITLDFPITSYQRSLLESAEKNDKVTLLRDQPNLDKEGRYWIAVAYSKQKPELLPFEGRDLVYLACGASSIGVLTEKGDSEVIKLWRSDKYWKPEIEAVIGRLKVLEDAGRKGNRHWKRLYTAKRTMQEKMAAQQKIHQRELAKYLIGLGKVIIVQDFTIRLGMADGSDPSRKELNWGLQNTGSIGRFIAILKDRAVESGKQVFEIMPQTEVTSQAGIGHHNKIAMAQRLREAVATGQI